MRLLGGTFMSGYYVKICFFLLVSLLLVSPLYANTKLSMLNKMAPEFKLESGAEEEITLEQIKSNVILLIYETRDVLEKNRSAKKALNSLFANDENLVNIRRLAIVDATKANIFTRPVWRSNFRDKSQEEGITIYGDWDGKMAESYNVQRDESNFILIDKSGVIRFYEYGAIQEQKIKELVSLIQRLAKEHNQ